MRVVVVGGDGRAHVLATVLGRHADVVATPGNPGIANSVATPAEELDGDLFVVSPEAPLVAGVADRLRAQGKLVFGPGADGAQLEGSKQWMKGLLDEAKAPTARWGVFTDKDEAVAYLKDMAPPYVIKTDGLAAGKGVLVTADLAEAADDVARKLDGSAFGDAGRTVVIEEGMSGPELSLLVVTDGKELHCLSPAQDYKRIGAGDTGPNTGGVGSFSPVPGIDDVVATAMRTIVRPTLDTLRRRGIDYRGVLYAGLMLTEDGPKTVEYNVRFGDPEAQVVLTRFRGDFAAYLAEAAAGDLRTEPSFVDDAAVNLALCAEGYPGQVRGGDVISGVEEAERMDGVHVFHAGTARRDDGALVTAGGRVLHVTALAPTISEARSRAYEAAAKISWAGMYLRSDIAQGKDTP